MNNDTLYLEVSKDNDYLQIGLHAKKSIWTYEKISAPMDIIEDKCHEMVEMLNQSNREGDRFKESFQQIKSIGRLLCDLLLTSDIKQTLKDSKEQNLILKLDEHLVHIPWELLYLDDKQLCLKFNIGREIKTRQKTAKNLRLKGQKPYQMWIITSSGIDLKGAMNEGIALCRFMDQMNVKKTVIESIHHSEIESFQINENISDYDILHFAGHADYDSDDSDNCGWKLNNGHLKASDIYKMKGNSGMPFLVFSNACQSARTNKWVKNDDNLKMSHQDDSFGLANAFMIAGVQHYIGTIWEITDVPGSQFALQFYRHLTSGKSIGESVRQARLSLINDHKEDISWASYLLYGDPTETYFKNDHIIKDNNANNDSSNQAELPPSSQLNVQLNSSPIKSDLRTSWPKSENNFSKFKWGLLGLLILSLMFLWYTQISDRRHELDLTHKTQVLKVLEEKIEKNRQRVTRLFDKYKQVVPIKQKTDNWTFGPFALAMVFDSHLLQNEKNQLILHAIQSRIMDSNIKILLVNRQSFDHILSEQLRNPPKQSSLIFPNILLSIASMHTKNEIIVLMNLFDISKGLTIGVLDVTLSVKQSILKQKSLLSDDLIDKLKQIKQMYPLRGLITQTEEKYSYINIGADEGVEVGQMFQLLNSSSRFKVVSVKRHQSKCVLHNGTNRGKKGAKVEYICH